MPVKTTSHSQESTSLLLRLSKIRLQIHLSTEGQGCFNPAASEPAVESQSGLLCIYYRFLVFTM